MRQELERLFIKEGYVSFQTGLDEMRLFVKYQEEKPHAVLVIDAQDGYEVSLETYRAFKLRIIEGLSRTAAEQGYETGGVEILTLVIGGDTEWVQRICAAEQGVWAYQPQTGRLLIYENQPGDFWGLRTKLENLAQPVHMAVPVFTAAIAAANVVVFLMLEFMGSTESAGFVAAHGGMYPEFILADGEWWRIFTAMFIHFGAAHLLNNMVILCCVGERLERTVGHIRFLCIYLLSGIGGGLLSLAMMVQSGDYAVSAGASGAIFGVIGGFFWAVIRHRGRLEGITARGMVLMIALSLYYGFSTIGIDNWCHLGGIFTGFVTSMILYHGNGQKD